MASAPVFPSAPKQEGDAFVLTNSKGILLAPLLRLIAVVLAIAAWFLVPGTTRWVVAGALIAAGLVVSVIRWTQRVSWSPREVVLVSKRAIPAAEIEAVALVETGSQGEVRVCIDADRRYDVLRSASVGTGRALAVSMATVLGKPLHDEEGGVTLAAGEANLSLRQRVELGKLATPPAGPAPASLRVDHKHNGIKISARTPVHKGAFALAVWTAAVIYVFLVAPRLGIAIKLPPPYVTFGLGAFFAVGTVAGFFARTWIRTDGDTVDHGVDDMMTSVMRSRGGRSRGMSVKKATSPSGPVSFSVVREITTKGALDIVGDGWERYAGFGTLPEADRVWIRARILEELGRAVAARAAVPMMPPPPHAMETEDEQFA